MEKSKLQSFINRYYLGPKSLTIEKYSKYFEIDGGYSKF